jgi:hypothetical protein
MQTSNRPAAGTLNLSGPVTLEALVEAFVSRAPEEHRPILRDRLLRSDRRIFAQSSDVEGQAILDRIYQLRLRAD